MTSITRRIQRSVSNTTRQANAMAHRIRLLPFATRGRHALFVLCAAMSATFVAPSFKPPPAKAAFPGRNGRIVFGVVRPPFTSLPAIGTYSGDRDIFTIGPNGGDVQQITTGIELDAGSTWSPDGDKIVFSRAVPPYPYASSADIHVVNANGSGLQNLTNTPEHYDLSPTWSPDGTKIMFCSDRASPNLVHRFLRMTNLELDLWVMDADGGNPVPLTSDPGVECDPTWSPDGRWIAFEDDATLALIRPNGSGRRVLRTNLDVQQPSWSPDGSKVAFAVLSNTAAWVINVDGSGLRNLTAGQLGNNSFPSWSPDGRWIAFMSDRDGDWKLYRMRPDGSDVQKLIDIDLQSPNTSLDWGPRP